MPFKLEELDRGRVLRVEVSGSLTSADYEPFVAEAEELIGVWGKLRLLIDLHDITGFSMGAAWQDLKFDLQHFGDIEMLAVVGEKQWHVWMTEICKPFVAGEVRFFSRSHEDDALEWIRNDRATSS